MNKGPSRGYCIFDQVVDIGPKGLFWVLEKWGILMLDPVGHWRYWKLDQVGDIGYWSKLRILDLGSSRGYWMLDQVGYIGN